jgi:hypothetical protein
LVQVAVDETSKANRNLYDPAAAPPNEFVGVGDPIKRQGVRQQWQPIEPTVAD